MATWQKRYQEWNELESLDATLKNELVEMKDDEQALEDAFYTELSFGTGGIRGVLGAGTNRLNIYTVRKAMKGLALYLEENRVNIKDRGIVIAYDSRYQSREFAIEAAKVFGVHGIRTYIFEELRPTPLLSFAVRYLGAVAGIMITASHNPPEYNGFKVYNEAGSQMASEEANDVIQAIQTVASGLSVEVMDQETLEKERLLEWINGQVDHAYNEQLLTISKLTGEEVEKAKDLGIVFSPLHGTALPLVEAGLAQLHFTNVHIVEEQAIPDPEFSTVDLPNPEERQAFAYAMKLGEQVNADILLATDPDADRLGAAVKNEQGEYEVLTGNQLGSLLLDYILSKTDPLLFDSSRLVKTIVTTELGRAIASHYGVETVDTLTGFKYIGEKINEYDTTGESFVFGYEESYGYLISGFVRDKDGVQAAVMACEMAQYWKDRGKSLIDVLHDLYERHGYYEESLQSITLEGITGKQKINAAIDYLRETDLHQIGDQQVLWKEDYQKQIAYGMQDQSEVSLTLPKENVIKYRLENDAWICIRPSGTEPKIKLYYGVKGQTAEDAKQKNKGLREGFNKIIGSRLV